MFGMTGSVHICPPWPRHFFAWHPYGPGCRCLCGSCHPLWFRRTWSTLKAFTQQWNVHWETSIVTPNWLSSAWRLSIFSMKPKMDVTIGDLGWVFHGFSLFEMAFPGVSRPMPPFQDRYGRWRAAITCWPRSCWSPPAAWTLSVLFDDLGYPKTMCFVSKHQQFIAILDDKMGKPILGSHEVRLFRPQQL